MRSMKRKLIMWLVIAVAAVACIAVLYHGVQSAPGRNATGEYVSQYESGTPIKLPVGDVYLNFCNGTPSRIFLVDSEATFGTFSADHIDQWDWSYGSNGRKDADRGDRFVSIDGTIRNDYDQRLDIALDARVYNKKGNQIGTLLRSSNRPEFFAAWTGLAAGDSGSFHLLLKLDRQYMAADVGRYEIVLAWEPSATPIP
jgi:hypothetical protein